MLRGSRVFTLLHSIHTGSETHPATTLALRHPASRLALGHTTPPHWLWDTPSVLAGSDKGMVRSDMSKPALIFFSLQEYTQQNTLSKF
jgi:hypothetical protein